MAGWIPVRRDLWDDPIFKKEPMSEREAFLWLAAKAGHEPTRHRIGNEIIEVPAGGFCTTLRELQSAWMWPSNNRVRRLLSTLEGAGLLSLRTVGPRNHHKTLCLISAEALEGLETAQDRRTDRRRNGAETAHASDGEQKEKPKDRRSVGAKTAQPSAQDRRGKLTRDTSPIGANAPIGGSGGEQADLLGQVPVDPDKPTSLPAEWWPTKADEQYAIDRGMLIEEIKEEADDFKEYWGSRTDKRARKTPNGWGLAWRSRIRDIAWKYQRNRRMAPGAHSGGNGQVTSIADAAARRERDRRVAD